MDNKHLQLAEAMKALYRVSKINGKEIPGWFDAGCNQGIEECLRIIYDDMKTSKEVELIEMKESITS